MSDQAAFYNEGVGHGGFIAVLSALGAVTFESFAPKFPSKKINQPNQIGAPFKAAGVRDFATASATIQLPGDVGPALGETFTDPNDGFQWWITDVSPTYQMGEYYKATIECQRVYGV